MTPNYCPNCGAAIEAGKKFCPSCGAKQPDSAAQPASSSQQTYQPDSQPSYGQQSSSQPSYGQTPVNQPPYGQQQPNYVYSSIPKKKKGGKTALIVIGSIVGFFVLVFVLASILLNAGSNLDYYKLDNDQVPTIKLVVGKRSMGLAETSRSNGVLTKSFEYKDVADSRADLMEYLGTLINEEGFIVTQSFNLDNKPGEGQIAKNSADSGQIILLDFSYYEGGYTFVFTKGAGNITPQ